MRKQYKTLYESTKWKQALKEIAAAAAAREVRPEGGITADACLAACDKIEAKPELSWYQTPESRSVLRIAPHGDLEVMRIESPYPYPGPLRRLLYWVLLGWRWERP